MNINFKAQPEPQLAPYGKTTYFACRHSPHPKSVCHIKGLNDVPVCVVKDRGYNDRHFVIPEHGQFYRNTGKNVDNSLHNTTLPSLVQLQPRQNVIENKRDELAKRTVNTPLLKQKDDPLRKYLGDRPLTRPITDHHLSSAQAMRYRPEITENLNYAPTYLENQIKVLQKLRDILQTDSLAEIQEWLGKATIKEKEFVSNLIHSDLTSRELLGYQPKPYKESEAERLNLQGLVKNKPESSDRSNQIRATSQISTASKGLKQRRSKSNLFSRTEKIRIPTSDNLPIEHSSSRATSHKNEAQIPVTSQNSTHLLYSRLLAKRSNKSSR